MPTLTIPPTDTPIDAWLAQLRRTAKHNLPLARRGALLRLVWQESYLLQPGDTYRAAALARHRLINRARRLYETRRN